MARILIVLPYSGRGFGGGLAVFNAELTKALRQEGHDVKLLTMQFTVEKINPKSQEHGAAEILCIEDSRALGMKDPGGTNGDKERTLLYEIFNDPEVLFGEQVKELLKPDEWQPNFIIGHSRFSGPAAIQLQEKWYGKAKAIYFIHSIPVEGTILTGYDVYEESISGESARKKFEKEVSWMPRAGLVVAVGPLICAGVTMMLARSSLSVPVHECIGGVDINFDAAPVEYQPKEAARLLFLGRASAPIKGLEDLFMAALALKDQPIVIDVRYWDDRTYLSGDVTRAEVQDFVNGLLGKPLTRNIAVNIKDKLNSPEEIDAEVRAHDLIVMPSYIEHFGLVPFDALGKGVPVLVNEISGAGMFLSDVSRVGEFGPACVVADFDKRVARPLDPSSYLDFEFVAKDAFDGRPQAWADAILRFTKEIPARFDQAKAIHEILKGFSWPHCARGIILAAEKDKSLDTQQIANGAIREM